MSQATEEKPQLLIDLTNARHATALDASSILHRMQIEAFLERVSEVVGRVEGFSEKLKQCGEGRTHSVSYERYHDVITLHGKRGSGKTTFLLSALELLQDPAKRKAAFPRRFENNADNDGLNGLCVLEILDPTLFGLHEHLLLSLMAKIAFEVRSAVKNSERNLCGGHNDHCKLEEWENRLRQFAKALKHMGETRDDLDTPLPKETVEWEDSQFIFEQNMENAQRSFGLEREFHKFLHDSLKLIDKKAFVLALDDIDTRPQIGWHVLEVLRRYFTSPQLVVVLSGDMDLFKTIIEKQQLKIFDLNFASNAEVRKEFKSRVDGLTEQYLLKILRTPSRINLGSLQAAVKQWERRYRNISPSVKKGRHEMLFQDLLEKYFFKFLACNTGFEQKLFQQALFLNPARTVTQVFDALLGHGHDVFVERMREIFLVSLQWLGFERPFDLAEALQTPQGVNLLVEQLFKRGFVSYGLELLPTRQSQDENNALLALHSELVFALQNNPAVFFAFALKACLLREVLLLQNVEGEISPYEKLERYLGLEMQEQPSITTAKISALHWDEPQSVNILRAIGLVRLYSKAIVKDMNVAVNAMYGRNVKSLQNAKNICNEALKEFCNVICEDDELKNRAVSALVNTTETLKNNIYSWQRDFVGLGFVDVSMRIGTNRLFSVFSLLSIMSDIIEADEDDIPRIFRKYDEVIEINAFNRSSSQSVLRAEYSDEGDVHLESERQDIPETDEKLKKIIDALILWAQDCKKMQRLSAPVILCARVMTRFFDALKKIHSSRDRTVQSTFVGEYAHRCLVSFFNSVLVEEFLLKSKTENIESDPILKVSLANPTNEDNEFLKNLLTTGVLYRYRAGSRNPVGRLKERLTLEGKGFYLPAEGDKQYVDSISDAFPFFKAVFSCPLWSLYLKPDYELKNDVATTVYGIYMRLLEQDFVAAREVAAVAYGTEKQNFENLYYLLNSLAIPKPEQGVVRNNAASSAVRKIIKPETRTSLGVRFGLPLSPKSIKSKKLLDDHDMFTILSALSLRPGGDDTAFTSLYEKLVRILYQDESVVGRLMDQKNLNAFWMYLRKNIKP